MKKSANTTPAANGALNMEGVDKATLDKLMTAANALATTPISINLIWQRAGFETHSSFSVAFLRVYGTTPTKYRQTHRPAAKEIDYISIAKEFLDRSETYPKLSGIVAEISRRTDSKINLSPAVLLGEFKAVVGKIPEEYYREQHPVPAPVTT